jgi:predicted lipid carrier protein YhbT
LLRRTLRRLPQYPHSVTASICLNALLRTLFVAEDAEVVRGKVVCLEVRDAVVRIKLRIEAPGYAPSHDHVEPDVTISADAYALLLVALRRADADTLFFERKLSIQGDTEVGLIVKNALDRANLPQPAGLFSARRRYVP